MELNVHRKQVADGTATLGDIFVNDAWYGFTLEDKPMGPNGKVSGETCIPSGRYRIMFREVMSGKTKQYREHKRYGEFFTWHLELQGVPGFDYVYIHAGNTPEHSEGCILVGYTQEYDKAFIGRSGDCFIALYKVVQEALENGEEVWINVQ